MFIGAISRYDRLFYLLVFVSGRGYHCDPGNICGYLGFEFLDSRISHLAGNGYQSGVLAGTTHHDLRFRFGGHQEPEATNHKLVYCETLPEDHHPRRDPGNVTGLICTLTGIVLIFGLSTIYRFYVQDEELVESHEKIYFGRAVLAGFLKGLIATGLGKLILPGIFGHKKIRSPAEAVGSTIVVIFIVNIVTVLFRLNPSFISDLAANADTIINVMIWVAPGVFIGGQIGPSIAQRLPLRYMKAYVGGLLIFVSMLMFIRAFALF
jgi:hypothetical protein